MYSGLSFLRYPDIYPISVSSISGTSFADFSVLIFVKGSELAWPIKCKRRESQLERKLFVKMNRTFVFTIYFSFIFSPLLCAVFVDFALRFRSDSWDIQYLLFRGNASLHRTAPWTRRSLCFLFFFELYILENVLHFWKLNDWELNQVQCIAIVVVAGLSNYFLRCPCKAVRSSFYDDRLSELGWRGNVNRGRSVVPYVILRNFTQLRCGLRYVCWLSHPLWAL